MSFSTGSRREFLAAALAALPLNAKGRFDRSRLSIFADEIGTLDEAIAFARQHRLKWIELRAYRPKPDSEWHETRRKLDAAGLGVSFFNSPLLKFTLPGTTAVKSEDFYENLYKKEGATPESLYARRDQDLDGAIRAAKIVGAGAIRTFAFWRTENPSGVAARIVELLRPMAAKCRAAGVALALENEFATNAGTTGETVAILQKVPDLYLNWDPQNSLALGDDVFPAGYAMLTKKRIANVQLKAEGLVGPGKPVDWAGIFRSLERDGYDGRFGLETHTLKGPEINVPASHACMKRMLELVGES